MRFLKQTGKSFARDHARRRAGYGYMGNLRQAVVRSLGGRLVVLLAVNASQSSQSAGANGRVRRCEFSIHLPGSGRIMRGKLQVLGVAERSGRSFRQQWRLGIVQQTPLRPRADAVAVAEDE